MNRDLVTALSIFLAAGVLGVSACAALGAAFAPYVAVLMAAAVLSAVIAMGQRVRAEIESRYRRTEALMAVYAAIEPRRPLPAPRPYMASPELLRAIVTAAFDERPGTILELGSGISTLVAAYALAKLGTGRIISLDHEARFVESVNRLLQEHDLSHVAKVLHAPLVDVRAGEHRGRWYDLAALEREGVEAIDLLVVDGPPGKDQPLARYPALPLLASRLSPKACIVVDDARRPDERAMVARWRSESPGWELDELPTEKGTTLLRRR